MLIKSKFEGYSKDGIRLYPIDGGGGGGGGPSSQTVTQDLPDWAQPYAKDVLGKGAALAEAPYQAYTGERQAQFTPLQQRAFQGAGALAPSAAIGQGIDIAGQAAQRAMGAQFNPYQAQNQYQDVAAYAPGQFQNRFQGPGAYQAGQFNADQISGPQLAQFQMGPAERVRADVFGGRQAAQYMSPFMEQAIAPQLREAQRSSEMMRNQNQAQAVQQGAFGGSRQAIVEAERQRNLGTQMGDIRSRGMQTAYEQAQNQFNQDAARRLQEQQLNQQAGLTTGLQNLNALLGVQQLGAQTGMQAQLANQQQAMEAQRLAEQSRQFGAGQGLTAAQLQAQYGLSADQASEASRQFAASQAAQQAAQRAQFGQSAQQLAEQSRQFGGSLGLQGLQAAMTGAGQLGGLGQQQFGQQKEVLGLQNQFGTQQQQQVQNILSQQYEDFLNQKRFPYQQLEFQSNLLRGTPSGSTQSIYQAPPSTASQLVGAGTALYGASRLAKGGSVSDAKVKREAKRSSLVDLALSQM